MQIQPKKNGILLTSKSAVHNQNYVHTPRPPLQIFLLLLAVLLSSGSAKAQAGQLPPLDSLEASLKSYLNKEWAAERAAYSYSQKGKALNYLPSVGFSFGLPSVGYSTQQLFSFLESKKARAAALESIDKKYQLRYNESLNSLRIEYEKLKLQQSKISKSEKAAETDRKIFMIYQEAFQKKELKPLEFLRHQKSYEDICASIEIQKQAYQIGRLELQKTAFYGVSDLPLYFEPEKDCIMLDRPEIAKNGR